jgi:pilus assembly protein Flp/PilA
MSNIRDLLKYMLVKAESGATAIEYGLIVALISLAIIIGAIMAGNGLNDMFVAVGTVTSSAGAEASANAAN